ncbi:hypothetical protein HMPREF0297_0723 [Corynebacterium jeikeium ATCC 43734]|nr:hypothetical protein HMPREF0297_0723 [Corynebacterium jeikeium ATCC 43734]
MPPRIILIFGHRGDARGRRWRGRFGCRRQDSSKASRCQTEPPCPMEVKRTSFNVEQKVNEG